MQFPMKPAHSLRSATGHAIRELAAILIVAVALLGLASCMDKGQATSRPKPDPAAAEAAGASEPTSANLTPNRKGTGDGWRWKGNRQACMFLVGKQCFAKREVACKAAGCAGDACKANSAVPALVSCEGK